MKLVLIIAWILAGISACVVPPDAAYLEYIDYRTIGLLFCMMAVLSAIKEVGVFQAAANGMMRFVKDTRILEVILVGLCFFTSMLMTNDVALITFVPFAITVLQLAKQEKRIVMVVVLQTIAANLGSMLTPIGNPQNLYLFSISGYDVFSFVKIMLPYTAVSFLLLCIVLIFRRNEEIDQIKTEKGQAMDRKQTILYGVLFLCCVLTVLRVLPLPLLLALIFICIRPRILKEVDYVLLLTFIGFFLFIGNMGRIPAFCNFLESIIKGREVLTGVIASQLISNVPAALLLSGFTDQYKALMIGTNLGGLGTLIASMASLISFRYIASEVSEQKGRFFVWFTVFNVAFLAVLYVCFIICQSFL